MRVLGVDLAWAEGSKAKAANETGVAAVDRAGYVLDAGWTVGLEATVSWVSQWQSDDTLLFVDAPLVVTNRQGQRRCETEVGRCYGRWKVSANSTNLGSRRLAGVTLRQTLERSGWIYHDGRNGPSANGKIISECYPYTTIVGAHELGFHDERPTYKRKPKALKTAEFRPVRANACDALIAALGQLETADPPLHLRSHPVTEQLMSLPSPRDDRSYKHREDLVDALICAWTALLWIRHGLDRCQVLDADDTQSPAATIIAPYRPTQRASPP